MISELDWELAFHGVPVDVLTPAQREVVYLRYVHELTFAEIADLTDRSREAVVKSHRIALVRIKNFVEAAKILTELQKTDTSCDIILNDGPFDKSGN